ncbi:diphthine synthase [Orbilia brochopaga]|uniref:Diphthine methyl ester synthase n=1 Tax=Orbilia brochopaga TaxID=3140254 RepID=A0AAV9UV18_9PEZI
MKATTTYVLTCVPTYPRTNPISSLHSINPLPQIQNMLYCIGLGLSDETDISVKGLEIVKHAERVYLEAYTSILMVRHEKLENFYGRQIILADRELVESESDTILHDAASKDVAFLVVGDPFGATTHLDLLLRAREQKIPVKTIHNASIMNAVGACGLQLYNFGQTVSMVFFTENWKPSSFYDKIKENVDIGLHTLILLDIKVKEQSEENLARGRKIYEPPRYMTVAQCARQMLMTEESRGGAAYGKDSLAIGIARLGSEDQKFTVGTLEELACSDLGPPLHSLVLVGRKIHDMEITFIRDFAIDRERFDAVISGRAYDRHP